MAKQRVFSRPYPLFFRCLAATLLSLLLTAIFPLVGPKEVLARAAVPDPVATANQPPAGAASSAATVAAEVEAGAAASGTVLRIGGCSVSRLGYLAELSAAFTRQTGIRVLIKGGGSMSGLLTLGAEASQLAASCLPPEAEIPAGIQLIPVAGDALVFITHRDNPLAEISLEQIRALFAGRISNWQQLGGEDRLITLYLQYSLKAGAGNHGVPFTLQQQVLAGQPINPDPRIFFPRPSGGLAEESVARDPAGFSVSGFTSARVKPDLKMLTVEGVAANKANISSGAYPAILRRYLYLGLTPEAPEAARRFLEFALSPAGQEVIAAQGAIALHELP